MYYAAIESGGTKFICAVADKDLMITQKVSIPTTSPKETLSKVFEFFEKYEILAMGIGSFGPIDINKQSPTYGHITETPKPGWANFDFVGTIKKRYDIPIVFTTDVNAAAAGELYYGAARGLKNFIYLTVGTGIGGGVIVKNNLLEGLSHPEMGHILLKRHDKDDYEGFCPYHKDCFEGLAAGPAIEKRWGKKAYELPLDHKAWEIQAYYLAQALMNYILILSPERIVLGGGVMKQEHLFEMTRSELKKLMNNYVNLPDTEKFIVPPKLGDNAGITGCIVMAKNAVDAK